ncbi:MAG: mannitol dehydrogenase family protein [Betaproteobacteria bacterium]
MAHEGTLSLSSLARLPGDVGRPAYDVAAVRVGIVHLGLGAFHRAHQAVYTDDVLATDPRWGICGVSMKTQRAVEPLAAQDGLYTLLLKDPARVTARVIGSIRETVFAPADPAALVRRMADSAVHVVTLTVTEKGYCHDPATGRLDLAHPDIAHDLAHPERPRSAVGILVAALEARMRDGTGALNVVCCDNLPHNGRVLEKLVATFAHAPELQRWIGAHAAFPCTMVDRIVPATTDADVADAARRLGVADAAPVVAEPFIQWVIENRFAAPRPAWERAGAEIAHDVAPYETMKLRLLNGSHSTLAYLGFLAGHATIAQAASDARLGRLVERQMTEEIMPTLASPPGIDLAKYGTTLLARFRNPALPHKTAQVAMDGSQKLPQRLLGTVRDRLARGASIRHLSLAVAGWMRYASGFDETGARIEVVDPLAERYAAIAADARGDATKLAKGLLGLAAVFGDDLPRVPVFSEAVTGHLQSLMRRGVSATLADHLAR